MMLGDNLDAIAPATVSVFPNKDHKVCFAAPKLEKLVLAINVLQGFYYPLTKTGEIIEYNSLNNREVHYIGLHQRC